MKLDIYISARCWACEEATNLAAAVSSQVPHVKIELHDITVSPRPDHVFATPTYILDGHMIYLGNPSLEELLATVIAV